MQLFAQARQQQQLFALESICRTNAIKQFSSQRLPGKLFLNVTPETLLQPDHQRGLTLELVNNSGMSPDQVVIEITEHSPTHDYELMRRAVCHYQQEGFSIALDDLGAGYSSLRLWSEVRPEFVKLDRHFVDGIDQDSFKRDFVSALVSLARSVNSLVIAEGIETSAVYQTLCAIGVDYLPGYYFARPAPRPGITICPINASRSFRPEPDQYRSVSVPCARRRFQCDKLIRWLCPDPGNNRSGMPHAFASWGRYPAI